MVVQKRGRKRKDSFVTTTEEKAPTKTMVLLRGRKGSLIGTTLNEKFLPGK